MMWGQHAAGVRKQKVNEAGKQDNLKDAGTGSPISEVQLHGINTISIFVYKLDAEEGGNRCSIISPFYSDLSGIFQFSELRWFCSVFWFFKCSFDLDVCYSIKYLWCGLFGNVSCFLWGPTAPCGFVFVPCSLHGVECTVLFLPQTGSLLRAESCSYMLYQQ